MKTIIFIIIFCLFSTVIFSQTDPVGKDEITQIEVSVRKGTPSIKLLREGLLCENPCRDNDHKYYPISTFIPIHRIDTDMLFKLQWFIKSDSLFYRDSVIEDLEFSKRIDEHPWINILIIHPDYSTNYILWETGESKTLEKCLKLLNKLIPENDRKVFAIEPGAYILSKERFERSIKEIH